MTPGPQVQVGMAAGAAQRREYSATTDISEDAVYLVTIDLIPIPITHDLVPRLTRGQTRLVRGLHELLDCVHNWCAGSESFDGEDAKSPATKNRRLDNMSMRRYLTDPGRWIHELNVPFWYGKFELINNMGDAFEMRIQRISEMALV